ncbi:hypothetical protein [Roseomonas elaeocarpi]|uniref:Lipoprotein n=1 Tax=Roseomonas elaeocarpi TaxID=907779 RepID=A0ABV6JYE3_9PROT
MRGFPFAAVLALLFPLAGCGDFPQPYRGQPGGLAAQLTQPPAYRIAVPPPGAALLTDRASRLFADDLAEALVAAEIPAVSGAPLPLDWRLVVRAEPEGRNVVPRYALQNADGKTEAEARGKPVPIEAWSNESPATLRRSAQADAETVATLLRRVDAARRAADPATLVASGPPPLRFIPVTGAPGDGNRALTDRMTDFLGNKGFVIQDRSEGAVFSLQGEVTVAPGANGTQRIEIQWIVKRKDGQELGRAVQINEIAPHSLDRQWGDVAYVVAQEAAQGVRDIIANAGGFGPAEAKKPAREEASTPAAPAGKGVAGAATPAAVPDNSLPVPAALAGRPPV